MVDLLKSAMNKGSTNLESVKDSPRVEEHAFPRVLVRPQQDVIKRE